MNRSLTSILGIIAIIAVIVAAVYYLVEESDDDLEIEIGMVQDAPRPPLALPILLG